jgi:hypothetical protein
MFWITFKKAIHDIFLSIFNGFSVSKNDTLTVKDVTFCGLIINVFKQGNIIMEAAKLELRIDQSVNFKPMFKDAAGNVTAHEAFKKTPTWTSSNTDIVTLEVSQDGRECVVHPTGALGTSTVTMEAIGESDSQPTDILSVVEITTVAGLPVQADISATLSDVKEETVEAAHAHITEQPAADPATPEPAPVSPVAAPTAGTDEAAVPTTA